MLESQTVTEGSKSSTAETSLGITVGTVFSSNTVLETQTERKQVIKHTVSNEVGKSVFCRSTISFIWMFRFPKLKKNEGFDKIYSFFTQRLTSER